MLPQRVTIDMLNSQGEKAILNGYNKGMKKVKKGEGKSKASDNDRYKQIRYPLTSKVDSARDKVYVLIQATLDGAQVEDFNLRQDMSTIFGFAARLCRCVAGTSALPLATIPCTP